MTLEPRKRPRRGGAFRGGVFTALLAAATMAYADEPADEAPTLPDTLATSSLPPTIVTATRTPKTLTQAPAPVNLITKGAIRDASPAIVSDLFRELPGLEVIGAGGNQGRPSIRGQRGQRILLLENGIRLNNSRRQQDFGEIPALVDVTNVERVEVVRGPSSVLYGTDAIGGVINVITQAPTSPGLGARLGYRHGSAGTSHKGFGSLEGRYDDFAFRIGGSYRDVEAYDAPKGTFGNITLSDKTLVNDTGVQDETINMVASYDLDDRHLLSIEYERYRADTTGFGYVDPDAYAPDEPFIEIQYPFQRFDKVSARYSGTKLGFVAADQVDVVVYGQDNERALNFLLETPAGPGATVTVDQRNFTDVETVGFRVEATKRAAARHLVTYGVDFFHDKTTNTDTSTSTLTGFGPPMVDESSRPLVPNARYSSVGFFAQDDIRLSRAASIILGARAQQVFAKTRETEGLDEPLVDDSDAAVVGAVNALYDLSQSVTLVGSVGRAFRLPNLVERFFDGPTPEGSGYQVRNPDLKPETSINVDLGARTHTRWVDVEGFVFRNEIEDAIRVEATGDSAGGFPSYRNVNVDKLRYTGVEVSGTVRLPEGFSLSTGYTYLSSKNLSADNPTGDGLSSRVTVSARYDAPRFFLEYGVRHNGERDDIDIEGNPIGETLPSFTVHTARAGASLFRVGRLDQRISLAVHNVTNELYAEFPNASFFRPEPERQVILTWETTY